MTVETNKVMAGVGTLYIAPYGEAFPVKTEPTLTWGGNWKDVGATKGGLTIETTTEFFEKEIDQSNVPIGREISKQSAKVKVSLAQSDVEKLKIAIPNAATSATAAGAGNVGLKSLKVGDSTPHTVYALGFECKSPESPVNSYYWRMYQFWRVTAGGTVSQAYKKGEQTVVDVEFTIEADFSKGADETIYRFDDMSAPKTT